MNHSIRIVVPFLLLHFILLSGCLSPIAMHQAVLSYDHTVTQVSSEQLLLNIVRARYHRPVHFTTVSSVSATFDFRMTAGITPPAGETRGLVAPLFSTTVAENPTVTIIPMDGEEFEHRLLTPLEEYRFLALLELGSDLGMALRMMGADMRLETETGLVVLKNDPGIPHEYEEYRRRSLHLSVLHRKHQLFLESVMVEQVWEGIMEKGPSPDDVLRALDKGYRWRKTGDHRYALNKSRVLLSNYEAERRPEGRGDLFKNLLDWPPNEILVDIRPEYPGGEFAFQGRISMRSFNSVLQFLARGMSDRPEYAVDQDLRTGPVQVNPPHTLQITESDALPRDAVFSVKFNDRFYSVEETPLATGEGANWNLKAFSMLYQLFQMTQKSVLASVPSIAIAK
ncbi:MAG: hypothetical protein JJE16_00235 [Nitrospiraceae bacterium]|nr:hypothetical protein [Nitrospiraceae bacterium]